MSARKIQWGIIGLGNIASQFCQGLLFSTNSELRSLASANASKEKTFREQYNFETFHHSYSSLLADSDVDIIYIATPNHLHFEQSKQALLAGKHVLCEKPACLTPTEIKELKKLSHEKRLFYMEALWTLFHPQIQYITEGIRSNQWGKLTSIEASFGFQTEFNPDSRLFNPELGGGSLYDIGIYPLLLSLYCLGIPLDLSAKNTFAPTGCDSASEIMLTYPNAEVKLSCSFNEQLSNEAILTFDTAAIRIPSMWHMPQDLFITQGGTEDKISFEHTGNGYNYEADHAADCILNGKIESPVATHQFSIILAELIQKALHQVPERH